MYRSRWIGTSSHLPMLAQPKPAPQWSVTFTGSIACPTFPLTVRRCRLSTSIGLSLGRSWPSIEDRPSAALIMRRGGIKSRLFHHLISSLLFYQIGRILRYGRGVVPYGCAKLVSLNLRPSIRLCFSDRPSDPLLMRNGTVRSAYQYRGDPASPPSPEAP